MELLDWKYLLLAAVVLFVAWRTIYWYLQGLQMKVSGYMPPPSPKIARATFKGVCWLITRLFVGPTTVIGTKNAIFTGRGMVLPNHTIWPDFAVVGSCIAFSYRQIAKFGEIKNFIVRTIAAWIGTVAVQVEGGKTQDGAGKVIVDAGANILVASRGSRLLIFSQGKLIYTEELSPKDFRTGATRMLLQAQVQVGDDLVYSLPVAICYKRDKSQATLLQRILYPLGLKLFRTYSWVEKTTDATGNEIKIKHKFTVYGAVVAIGEPIDVKSLPSDPREAIEVIRRSIVNNFEIAKAESRGTRNIAA